jgi:hypothetical protein
MRRAGERGCEYTSDLILNAGTTQQSFSPLTTILFSSMLAENSGGNDAGS